MLKNSSRTNLFSWTVFTFQIQDFISWSQNIYNICANKLVMSHPLGTNIYSLQIDLLNFLFSASSQFLFFKNLFQQKKYSKIFGLDFELLKNQEGKYAFIEEKLIHWSSIKSRLSISSWILKQKFHRYSFILELFTH